MADIKISELTAVSSLNNGDLVEVSQVNELAPSGYTSLKASMADIGKKVNTDIEYTTDLADFADKTTLGAIKETAKGKNIADEYDDTQTYNKGDVVIYKNTLYICTTNNTTGDFDPTKWTATTVQSLIGSLSSLTTTNNDSLVDAVNEVNGGKLDKFIIYQTTSNAVTLLFDNIGDMAIVLINRGYNAYDGAFVLMTGSNNSNALVVELYKGSSIDTVYKAPDGKGFTISSTEMSGSKIVVIPISGTPTISG